METVKRTKNKKISTTLEKGGEKIFLKNDINADRIIELQDRLCKSNKRDITTEDLVYIS